jgi:hypothetical protein
MSLFEQLDFIYEPSQDVARDMQWFAGVLGARIVFAVEAMDTRVAMLELSSGPPAIVLTGHLEGERPIFIYRVADLGAAMAELRGRGWHEERVVEIPMGPCCSFEAPGGHRVALYQATRSEVIHHFEGRRDF